MKYFTNEWWTSRCEDNSVLDKYQEYLSSISSKLPNQLLSIQNEFTLHDANIKEISSNYKDNTVTIRLNGWDKDFEEKVIYKLKFKDVKQFDQILPQDEFVESDLGDLGYWEYEVKGNTIEMRMLFSSRAEFIIQFCGFDFEYE